MPGLLESTVDVVERANNTRMGNPLGAIEEHFIAFQGLVRRASKLLAEARYDESALYVQVAAEYAWFHPSGLFASPELDGILAQIGRALPHSSGENVQIRPPSSSSRNVLHVLTEAYGLGGHTRFVWRWIQNDAGRCHSVVLTRQGEREPPEALLENVAVAGGAVHYLDRHAGRFLTRVQALRRVAAEADQVVLHTHPYDVIPLIAFAGIPHRPRITLMNHADHVFWPGGSLVDQVAHIRGSGRRLSERRRGIAQSRCPLVPVPLGDEPGPSQRSGAKKKLGLPEDAVVLLTIASSYKYASIGDTHFADVLLPVLQKYPNAVLYVIGTEACDEWVNAAQQAGGRMQVLGKRHDTDLFYQAADIYLDSFPFSSLTSVLEAGCHGTPIVSYRLHPEVAEVLYTDDPALTNTIVHAPSVEGFRQQVSRLIEDGDSRRRIGAETRESIIAVHVSSGWNRFVEEMYSGGSHGSPTQPPSGLDQPRDISELDVRLVQIFARSGLSKDLPEILCTHLALFPLKVRLGIWRETFGGAWRSLPHFLPSDWQKTKIKRLRSRLFHRNG